jgi:glycerol-3-phosphate dehydrogenase
MKRDLSKLANTTYDLLVIGGGITGACAAWDASLRGLSVALVDKGDFGAATSAASGKIIHGGIRYIQYGALRRVRESLHERMIFQSIAPHLVRPIRFLIPTFGHWLKGKEILTLGMMLYDLLALDKKNSKDPENTIPGHRILSRKETLDLAPDLIKNGLSGGILYYDCQMHNPERLTLSFLLSANEAGADLANYLKVIELRTNNSRITGVKVRDILTGQEFGIQARVVLNASGPWVHSLLSTLKGSWSPLSLQLSKGIHIITRPLIQRCALALASKRRHAGALVQRGGRHLFIIPWRNHSIIGTTNVPFEGSPDKRMVTEEDIQGLLGEINAAYPGANLGRDDVVFFYGGLYPDKIKRNIEEGYQGSRKDQILDHTRTEGIKGLISLIGVKYTTARQLAQGTIDLVFGMLGYKPPECLTEKTPIYGGQIERFNEFLNREIEKNAGMLKGETISHLVSNYGSAYARVIDYAKKNPGWYETVDTDLPVTKAEVIHAVREEMAQKLTDVIFRRTGLGTVGNPGKSTLNICASIMAEELGWNIGRVESELQQVREVFTPA